LAHFSVNFTSFPPKNLTQHEKRDKMVSWGNPPEKTLTKRRNTMANAHKQTKRDLLNMLTTDTLLGLFTKQARNAVKKGATEGPSFRQVKSFAADYSRQLRRELKACETSTDFANFGAWVMARLDPNAVEYRLAMSY
jgi:hypothetical protein